MTNIRLLGALPSSLQTLDARLLLIISYYSTRVYIGRAHRLKLVSGGGFTYVTILPQTESKRNRCQENYPCSRIGCQSLEQCLDVARSSSPDTAAIQLPS